MINHTLYRSISAFILITASLNVSAVVCNSASPNLKAEGDEYYNIEQVEPLTRKQISAIKDLLFSFVQEDLKGSAITTECIGFSASPEESTSNADASAELNMRSDGRIVFRIEAYDKKEKATKKFSMDYLGNNSNYKIIELGKNKINFSRKLRNKNALHEEIVEISRSGRSVAIDSTLYINGYFGLRTKVDLHY